MSVSRYILCCLISVGGLLVPCARGDDGPPAEEPAEPTTRPSPAERLAEALHVIRESDTFDKASKAYTEAVSIDRDVMVLHEAYMERMLRFGLVKLASYPARRLVTMEPDHGLARAVLGYRAGREGERAEAFEATMLAARRLPGNPGVLNNAGQLAAWFERADDRGDVSAEARRLLDTHRKRFMEREEFARAYERVSAAYAARAEQIEALEEQLADARRAVRELAAPIADMEAALRGISAEIDARKETIDDLEDDLDDYDYYIYNGRPYRRRAPYRDEIRALIRAERLAIERLTAEGRQIQARLAGLKTEYVTRKAELDMLTGRRSRLDASVREAYRWDPPAVDGEITAAIERPSDLPPSARSVEEDEDRPPRAQQRLNIAMLYLKHDMPEKARTILEEVAAQDESPDASREARLLLDDLDRRE